MRLIKPSYKIIKQEPGINGIYKMIEYAGRVCYKSEDKIIENSASGFVDRMIKSGHGAVLEHGTVYLTIPAGICDFLEDEFDDCNDIKDSFYSNPYTNIHCQDGYFYISTNYRVLVEKFDKKSLSKLLQYICEPTHLHKKRITVHFVCDRGVSHEFVRHRVFSFAQESTRYCNYSKDKFGNELTFIQPCYLDEGKLNIYGPYHTVVRDKSPESIFIANLNNAEQDYLDLLKLGWKPQEARAILPNALKTEIVMTGFVSDWEHFFRLRTSILAETGKPHPQAQELADPLMDEFISDKYF